MAVTIQSRDVGLAFAEACKQAAASTDECAKALKALSLKIAKQRREDAHPFSKFIGSPKHRR